jgi:hypothetical protein
MLCEMVTTAAGPDYVLIAGKTYHLPSAVAKRFLEPEQPVEGRYEPFAKRARPGAAVTPIPPQPDPEDRAAFGDVDEDGD